MILGGGKDLVSCLSARARMRNSSPGKDRTASLRLHMVRGFEVTRGLAGKEH